MLHWRCILRYFFRTVVLFKSLLGTEECLTDNLFGRGQFASIVGWKFLWFRTGADSFANGLSF